MADKILLEIEIEDASVTAAVTEIQKAKEAITQLQAANKALADQGQSNSTQFIKNNEDIKTLNKTISDNSKVVQANNQLQKAQVDSIDALRAQNSLLLKEKNSLSTSDEASKKRIAEINTLYDKNTETIKNNSSATEKQKMNIGNYKSGLDALAPGLSGTISGIEGTTKASLAFIATPIGAVIAALGIAIGSVMAYFKSSEEAENKLAKATAVLGAVFEQLKNFAEALGEKIVGLFENPQQALKDFANLIKENITNRFEGMLELIPQLAKAIGLLFEGEFVKAGTVAADAVIKVSTGIADASGKMKGFIEDVNKAVELGINNGLKLAEIQRAIDLQQRKLIEERAKTDLEVSKLREKAISEEGDLKRKTIQEAIDLEKALADQEVKLFALKQQQAALELQNNGDDKAAKDKLAQANADLITAEAGRYQATLRFQKELEKLNDQEVADNKKKLEEEEKANQKYYDDTIAAAIKANDEELKAAEELTKLLQQEQDKMIQSVEDRAQTEINILKNLLLEGKISRQDYNQEVADLELGALQAEAEIKKQFGESDLQLQGQITDAKIKIIEQETAARQKQYKTVSDILGQTANLFGKQTIAYKVLASGQAIMNTYAAATAALAPPPLGAGPIIGPIFAALAIAQGIANVAKINSVNLPSFEDGGVIPISGRSHTQGGEDVAIGGRKVANVQSGEHMVVLKRGAYNIYEQLSRANELAGGVAFAQDNTPRRYLADGGLMARTASPSSPSNDQLSNQVTAAISSLKIYTRTTELAKVQANVTQVRVLSELT